MSIDLSSIPLDQSFSSLRQRGSSSNGSSRLHSDEDKFVLSAYLCADPPELKTHQVVGQLDFDSLQLLSMGSSMQLVAGQSCASPAARGRESLVRGSRSPSSRTFFIVADDEQRKRWMLEIVLQVDSKLKSKRSQALAQRCSSLESELERIAGQAQQLLSHYLELKRSYDSVSEQLLRRDEEVKRRSEEDGASLRCLQDRVGLAEGMITKTRQKLLLKTLRCEIESEQNKHILARIAVEAFFMNAQHARCERHAMIIYRKRSAINSLRGSFGVWRTLSSSSSRLRRFLIRERRSLLNDKFECWKSLVPGRGKSLCRYALVRCIMSKAMERRSRREKFIALCSLRKLVHIRGLERHREILFDVRMVRRRRKTFWGRWLRRVEQTKFLGRAARQRRWELVSSATRSWRGVCGSSNLIDKVGMLAVRRTRRQLLSWIIINLRRHAHCRARARDASTRCRSRKRAKFLSYWKDCLRSQQEQAQSSDRLLRMRERQVARDCRHLHLAAWRGATSLNRRSKFLLLNARRVASRNLLLLWRSRVDVKLVLGRRFFSLTSRSEHASKATVMAAWRSVRSDRQRLKRASRVVSSSSLLLLLRRCFIPWLLHTRRLAVARHLQQQERVHLLARCVLGMKEAAKKGKEVCEEAEGRRRGGQVRRSCSRTFLLLWKELQSQTFARMQQVDIKPLARAYGAWKRRTCRQGASRATLVRAQERQVRMFTRWTCRTLLSAWKKEERERKRSRQLEKTFRTRSARRFLVSSFHVWVQTSL